MGPKQPPLPPPPPPPSCLNGDDQGNMFGTKVDEMNSIEVDFRKVEDSFCYQLIQQETVQRLHQQPLLLLMLLLLPLLLDNYNKLNENGLGILIIASIYLFNFWLKGICMRKQWSVSDGQRER